MSKEPKGALTLAEMDSLREVHNAGCNERPPTGEKFYYCYATDGLSSGYHSRLAFLPNIYYFRNYFHALAHLYRVKQGKADAYRDNKNYIDYPDIAPKTKRR